MMYLSTLLIDTGINPDRPRPAGSGSATSIASINACAWPFRLMPARPTIRNSLGRTRIPISHRLPTNWTYMNRATTSAGFSSGLTLPRRPLIGLGAV